MTPRAILEVAEKLLGGETETDWRSAVSRAYFAAFHVARRLLLRCGFNVPRGDQAHAYLWLRLSNSGHPDVQQTGADLGDLRRMRNGADYDLDNVLAYPAAAAQFYTATEIIELLEEVQAEPRYCTVITEAIKTYERDVLRQVTWRS